MSSSMLAYLCKTANLSFSMTHETAIEFTTPFYVVIRTHASTCGDAYTARLVTRLKTFVLICCPQPVELTRPAGAPVILAFHWLCARKADSLIGGGSSLLSVQLLETVAE